VRSIPIVTLGTDKGSEYRLKYGHLSVLSMFGKILDLKAVTRTIETSGFDRISHCKRFVICLDNIVHFLVAAEVLSRIGATGVIGWSLVRMGTVFLEELKESGLDAFLRDLHEATEQDDLRVTRHAAMVSIPNDQNLVLPIDKLRHPRYNAIRVVSTGYEGSRLVVLSIELSYCKLP
jgi:hypothetical protein